MLTGVYSVQRRTSGLDLDVCREAFRSQPEDTEGKGPGSATLEVEIQIPFGI